MIKIYYDKDAKLSALKKKKIVIMGYGSQGHAHANNLKESGMDVTIGLRKGSSWDKAAKAGFKVFAEPETVADSKIGYTMQHSSLFYVIEKSGKLTTAPLFALEAANAIRDA